MLEKPMSGNEALLHAILDRLDDDVPRLSYADWLQAQGESAMAEFIRLEVERGRLPDVPQTDQALDLERRAARLFRQHRARWLGPLHRPKGRLISFSRSERGLLYLTVRGTAANVLRKADGLLGGLLLPYALDVGFTRLRAELARVITWPYLARMSNLYLEGQGLGAEEAGSLAGCKGLCHLRQLWLFDNEVGDAGAAALARSPHLGRLESLAIVRDHLTASALLRLLRSRHLAQLKWLWLGSNLLRLEGLAPYRPARGGPRLTALTLRGKGLDDAAAAWAAASLGLATLNTLELSDGALGPGGAAALAASRYLAGLWSLNLSDNPLGDAGVRALAASPHLTALGELWLDNCGVGPKGAQALLDAPHPPRWTHLYDNPLGQAMRRRLLAHEPRRFSA
jgi:uncharacterized protein (TIGR02996 family)